jgi:hypothetical protein
LPNLTLGWAIRLSLAGVAALGAAAPSWAERPVALSTSEAGGYGRITAKWSDGDQVAPKITASIAGNDQVLVLRFDQKVAVDLEALRQGLPSWAAATRMDADGMTARIGLKQPGRLHVSTSVDLAAVDLLPKEAATDPPDIVSPLAAVRAKEEEAKRIAALPAPVKMDELEVRGSHSGESSRIAFYWPARVAYKVVEKGEGRLKLLFAHRAKADAAYLRITPPPNLEKFDAENTDKGYLVTITSKDKLPIKHFFDGDVAVVDITRPSPPEAAPQQAAKPEGNLISSPPKTDQVAAKPVDEKPILLAPPKNLLREESETAKDTTEAPAPLPDTTLGGKERVTELAANWTDPAPRSGVVDVKVVPLANGLELEAIFATPAPAAVFSRGSTVWAVFAANADLKIDQATLPAGYRVRTMRVKNATMMRIEAPKGLAVSAEAHETSWSIRLAPTALKPHRFLKPERKAGRVETMLVGASGLVWFEDPVIGDMVAAAVSYGPSSASPTPRDFIEASMPATAHGLAFAPKSDEVIIAIDRERVIASMSPAQPAPESQVAVKKPEPPKAVVNPAFIDFVRWGPKKGEDFFKRQSQLNVRAAGADSTTAEGAEALLDLARFYLAHEMDLEALGVLKVAASERRELESDPAFLGLRGVANYMAHRLGPADDALSRGSLRGDPSTSLWRAMVAVGRAEWERASEHFRASASQIDAYPPQKAATFAAAWAEAALNTNDYDGARRHADFAIASGDPETVERGKLVLASLKAVIDGPDAAYPELERLSQQASEPIAVRAELKRLEAGIASGRMMASEAAGELETLRFRWRGDDVEMATVGILADQYMRVGRFRDALLLTQSTALRDVDAPGARELRLKLSDYFRRLFLNGEADRLDPIQALALFYEFADHLTPIGNDGDQMIRKLAQRLVAFDLLEPASQLLQYQVDNRIRGIGKSAIAVDLATIYLWDKRPEKALAAINTTRQPSLPKELALERRLLEAAAYRDLGRFDHVVELVEGLEGVEAKSLLADAYWRDRKYPEAARAFIAMLPAANAVQAKDADILFKAAIAARMARDMPMLADLRRYAGAFEGSPNKASFDLITSQASAGGAALSEAARRLGDAPRIDAFSDAMKQRFEAPKAAPARTAAAPAASSGGAP